ncbi:vesicular inhibitory amino acid transporter-like, partial [Actinia tenebrosa]|uniref:Vesicular inhibitory amino acid transporter-like n=1 Tax=Actinia tenebrosa TaxID=6105 RepID=A0A6P8J236_ACTTE
MDRFTGVLQAVLPKSLTRQKKTNPPYDQYSHVPKEEESFTEEDFEFGGKAYTLGVDNDDKTEEQTNEKEGAKEEREEIDINEKKGKTSSLQAAWNISNLIQGTGTLGIPYAVSKGGYLSLAAIVLIAVVTNYTGKLIVRCLYDAPVAPDQGEKGRRIRKSYAELGHSCWKRNGALLVCGAQVLQTTCACILYVLLVADFFNDVYEKRPISLTAWTVLAGLLLLPSVFINQLSRISWLSMFSVFALFVVFVTVMGYGLTQRHTWSVHMPLSTLEGFPVAWGIILFSFVSHPYLPGIEENMASPESFDSVMNYSSCISAITKVAYGFIAVLTFKDSTKQEISENLPPGVLENSANALLGLNGLFSFALPSFTLFNILNKMKLSCLPRCFPDDDNPLSRLEKFQVYTLRMLFVGVTVLIAIAISRENSGIKIAINT